MQVDWTKILNAGINQHFDSAKAGKTLYIEGQTTVNGVDSWAELRINGPDYREQTKNEWVVNFSVDIMCLSKLTTNIYSIHDLIGLFQVAMVDFAITIQTGIVVCFKRQSEIKIIPWGIVKRDVDLFASSIMSDYKGEFQCP